MLSVLVLMASMFEPMAFSLLEILSSFMVILSLIFSMLAKFVLVLLSSSEIALTFWLILSALAVMEF